MITKELNSFVAEYTTRFDSISDERKKILNKLSVYIQERVNNPSINLVFICTHNSRRSHFSQVWAQIAAHYYGLHNISSYSGGTEATAVFPSVINALTSNGVKVEALSNEENPVYTLKYSETKQPIIGFSKVFNHTFNPSTDFAAVMTCTDADENCPLIPNATRVSLPFNDPKVFDNTADEQIKYQEKSKEIATELFYALSQVKL